MKQAVPWWFFFPDVTFHCLMWLLRIAAVPWGWCDFSRLMWLKYGACSSNMIFGCVWKGPIHPWSMASSCYFNGEDDKPMELGGTLSFTTMIFDVFSKDCWVGWVSFSVNAADLPAPWIHGIFLGFSFQWIGWREKKQESLIFNEKIDGFL